MNRMSSNTPTNYNSTEILNKSSVTDCPSDISLEKETTEVKNEKSVVSKIRSCFLRHKLEIFTFIFTFSYTITDVTSTAMILDKVCLVHLKYNSSVCEDLENYTDVKDTVEKLATHYQLGHSLLQTAPATILACFIGPWSDRYGRILPIMVALVGLLLDSVGSAICAYLGESRVEYYFIPAIFTGLSGGSVAIMAVVYSYCCESSTVLERTMKYAFVEMSVGFATSIGVSAGGWTYKGLGYGPVFLIAAFGLTLSFILANLLLEETRGLDIEDPWSVKIKELFSCKMLMEGFAVMMKQRPNKGRRQIVLLIISGCLIIITMNSEGNINYLYAHHQFGWDNTTYSNVKAIYSIAGIVVLVLLIPLFVYFRIEDPCLGLLGTVSLFGKSLVVGLSRNVPSYHAANIIGILGGVGSFATRSRISKLSHKDDLGTMFSFVSAAESLLPILASVLISELFAAYLHSFPGMPYIVLSITLLLPLGVFSWMLCLPKMRYEDLNQTPLPEIKTEDDGFFNSNCVEGR